MPRVLPGGEQDTSSSAIPHLQRRDPGPTILEQAMRRPTPAPAAPAAPARPALAAAPQPDPLSYVTRETITPEAADRGRQLGLLHPELDKAEQAQKAEEDRAEREKILGISTGALSTTPELIKDQLHQLTDEEYAHLSAKQRAAVDYNTMLATAVRKDLRRQDRYAGVSEQQKATYDESVKNMFGADRGSDLYAPETMAVLRQLKIDDANDDLDDYLNLKVAITEDDLKSIDPPKPSPAAPASVQTGYEGLDENARGRLGLLETAVEKTQQMQQSLAKGREMLQSFQATAAAERADDLGRLGGSSPLASRPGLGFQPAQFTETGAPADLNTYFRTMFDALSDEKRAGDRPQLMQALQADLYPDELEAFKSYADARTRNTRQYGALMGSTEGAEYTSPKEFRKLLGLDQ